MSKQYEQLVASVVKGVGGAENITAARPCPARAWSRHFWPSWLLSIW